VPGVTLFGRCEPPVHLGELRPPLGLGQRAIQRRPVDFALEVRAIAGDGIGLSHPRSDTIRGS